MVGGTHVMVPMEVMPLSLPLGERNEEESYRSLLNRQRQNLGLKKEFVYIMLLCMTYFNHETRAHYMKKDQ